MQIFPLQRGDELQPIRILKQAGQKLPLSLLYDDVDDPKTTASFPSFSSYSSEICRICSVI
jgi:hypothetical protein